MLQSTYDLVRYLSFDFHLRITDELSSSCRAEGVSSRRLWRMLNSESFISRSFGFRYLLRFLFLLCSAELAAHEPESVNCHRFLIIVSSLCFRLE